MVARGLEGISRDVGIIKKIGVNDFDLLFIDGQSGDGFILVTERVNRNGHRAVEGNNGRDVLQEGGHGETQISTFGATEQANPWSLHLEDRRKSPSVLS